MIKPIRKLKKLVGKYLYLHKNKILYDMGAPDIKSDDFIWFYTSHYFLDIFKLEIIFIFEEDVVVDISLTEYIFRREYSSTFYYENAVPEFKTHYFLFSK